VVDGNPKNSLFADFSSTQLATFTLHNVILSEEKKVAFVSLPQILRNILNM